jgi:hypothetical protein
MMSAEHYDLIVSRIRTTLGPEWEASTVAVNEPLSWISPRLVAEPDPDEPLLLSWEIDDDANVARGLGDVLAMGNICGYSLFEQATLDDVLTKVVNEWQKRKNKKRGWFSR